MAVVAVGDFDVAQVEAMIKQHFSSIPRAASSARPRVVAAVPDNVAPLIAITSDAEATSSSFTIAYKHPRKLVSTVGDYRTQIAEGLYCLDAECAPPRDRAEARCFLFASVGEGAFSLARFRPWSFPPT